MGPSIALQLYTVRRQLAEDFLGTLRRIRDIGYTAVETASFPEPISPAVAGKTLKSLGLEVAAMHCGLPLGNGLKEAVELSASLDCRRVIWHGWPRSEEFDSSAGIRRLADSYNQADEMARANGLEFGLHNHWWEFEPIEGLYPYRLLNERLNPDIFLEIDVYWVKTAGLDPSLVIAELGPRVRFLHVKDGPAVHGQPMTAAGEGAVDLPKILGRIRSPAGLIVELDECATDVFTAVERSHRFLQGLVSTMPTQSPPL